MHLDMVFMDTNRHNKSFRPNKIYFMEDLLKMHEVIRVTSDLSAKYNNARTTN